MLDKDQIGSTMATESSDIPILGSATPQERRRYVRTRICVACSLLVILVIVIVLPNLGSSSSDAASESDWQEVIISTTSAEGARNNSKYMSSMPHILGKIITL